MTKNQASNEINVERLLNAPREMVFRAWTEPQHVSLWWGPDQWALPECSIDLKKGGEWRYCMRGQEGKQHWVKAVFQEVVPPERLVYEDGLIDADGNDLDGMPHKVVTVTFEDLGAQTRLQVNVHLESSADLERLLQLGFSQGFQRTLEQLAAYMENGFAKN